MIWGTDTAETTKQIKAQIMTVIMSVILNIVLLIELPLLLILFGCITRATTVKLGPPPSNSACE